MRRSLLSTLRLHVPRAPVAAWFAAALALHTLTAWLHRGVPHPDEHYQILEFAWAKLGRAPFSSLPWEYAERIRPALQPAIAAALIRIFELAGRFNPFVVTFVLRLVSGLLGLWVTAALCARVVPSLRDEWLRRFALAGSLFFWIAAPAHVRFSAENWGGIWLFAGICLVLDALDGDDVAPTHRAVLSAAAGAAWAVAFQCRFQVGFALVGIACWLVLMRRASWRLVAAIVAGGLVVAAANTCLDRWFYGAWVCTPLNYFRANIIEGRAASFGTSPAWMTVMPLLTALGLPFSIAFVLTIVAGAWYARRHILVWTIVPFVIAHAMVAHKEARFMAPVLYGLVPLIAVSFDALPRAVADLVSRWRRRPLGRLVRTAMWTANAAALVVVTALPLDDRAGTLQWLWEEARSRPFTLYSLGGAPYDVVLQVNYYRPPGVRVRPLAMLGREPGGRTSGETRALALYEGLGPLHLVPPAPVECLPIMQSQPGWLLAVGRLPWVRHRSVWSICEARGADGARSMIGASSAGRRDGR